MPLIRLAKGVYGLYRGKKKKNVGKAEIVGYYIGYRNEEGRPVKEPVNAGNIAEASLMLKQRIVERDRIKNDNMIKKASLAKGKVTISRIAEEYFKTRRNAKCDRNIFRNHLAKAVGDMRHLRPMDVTRLQNHLLSQGLSPKSVNNYTDLLRTILRFGIKNNLIDKDTYAMHRYKKMEVDNIVEKFLSPEEVRELFSKALLPDKVLGGEIDDNTVYEPSFAKKRLQFLLKMLYYTGQRPISVLRLQKRDITYDTKNGWKIDIAPVKKQKKHSIPIAKDLFEDLMDWIKPLEPDHYLFHPELSPSKQISKHTIVTQGKALFNSYNKGKDFKKDRKEWITFYTLRHSAATNILASTGSLKLAGTLLNHSSAKMTERYAKVLDSAIQGAVDGL